MENVIIAIISSGILSTLITALFQYLQTKRSQKDGLESKVDTLVADQASMMAAQKKQEGDILRVELKLMISDFPEKEEDILRLGEHYFKDLKANWVMASVYQQWLTARNLPIPPWFRSE